MATTDTSICNQALLAIGTRSTIANLSEQSVEAGACNLIYEQTRDEMLRSYQWTWARRQKPLAVLKAARGTPENPDGLLPEPPLPWLYEYAYPTDCASVTCILPVGLPQPIAGIPLTTTPTAGPIWPRTPPIKFILSGDVDIGGNPIKVILTNQYQAILVFTAYVRNPAIWDDTFIRAMIGRMAAQLVIPLAGDKTLAKMAIDRGMVAEADAEKQSGNEAFNIVDVTPDWINARGYDDFTESDLYVGGGIISDIN